MEKSSPRSYSRALRFSCHIVHYADVRIADLTKILAAHIRLIDRNRERNPLDVLRDF